MPENSFHSTIERPDSVSRVTPPRTTMQAMSAKQTDSQREIARRCWERGERWLMRCALMQKPNARKFLAQRIRLDAGLIIAMVRGMIQSNKTLAEKWLRLGVAALAIAGIFAIILVVARTPQLKQIPVLQGLFDVALVVHVDLSVLMWFLCVLGMGVAGIMQRHDVRFPCWSKTAFFTVSAATILMALSPLHHEWEVIKSNYIPVLFNGIFFLSLGLLSAGLVVLLLPLLVTYCCRSKLMTLNLVELGFWHAGWCVFLALIGFFLSAQFMPKGLPHDKYFETLFWAGGHILQFAFALLMMAAWVRLMEALEMPFASRRWISFAYGVTTIGAVASLAAFAIHTVRKQ